MKPILCRSIYSIKKSFNKSATEFGLGCPQNRETINTSDFIKLHRIGYKDVPVGLNSGKQSMLTRSSILLES